MRSSESYTTAGMEAFKKLPDGTLAELIDGELFMSPSPNSNHQEISVSLTYRLVHHLEQTQSRGRIYVAPFDVFLDEDSNVVEPDIVFIAEKNLGLVKEDGLHGVPDMVIEILSPSNPTHDLVRKKGLYEKHGVPEYWIIFPETLEAVGHTLNNGIYSESGRLIGKIRPKALGNHFFEFKTYPH